jgi:hypothetical protein
MMIFVVCVKVSRWWSVGEGEVAHEGDAAGGLEDGAAFAAAVAQDAPGFMWAKACSTRARTPLWMVLSSSFQSGNSLLLEGFR